MAANGGTDECPEVEAETRFDVLLYIYDLSKELAKSFKKILKGKPLPGIWHTGLVAYGREYYFGSSGIESCRPGETILGEPDQILTLGKTELPYSVFLEYIFALGESSYRPGSYHLLEHNCNCFSQEVSNFLTGGPIPEEIRELPQEISSNKNLSSALKEYFDKLSLRAEGSKGISFGHPSIERVAEEQRNGHLEPEVQKQSGRKKSLTNKMPVTNGTHEPASNTSSKKNNNSSPAATAESKKADVPEQEVTMNHENHANAATSQPAAAPSATNHETQATEAASAPSARNNENQSAFPETARQDDDSQEQGATPPIPTRRSRKYDDPPIIYADVDGVGSFNQLMTLVEGKLTPEEKTSMNELLEYLTSNGGAWALGNPHLETISRLLNDRSLPCEVPILTLKVMQAAALKEDVILLLHQDRKDHLIMSYLFRIEKLPEEEQEQIATFMCNLCSNNSSFDWLMYISEWEEEGQSCNNSRVTVRVAVNSLLSQRKETHEKGSALIYNLALKELFDDTATELAMAVLQYLQSELNEELLFRSLTALLRFMAISYNDVPALLKMLGPDVNKFSGTSERIDQLIQDISVKLRISP